MSSPRKAVRPSLDRFFARIDAARAELGLEDGEECFYRGHANADWPLQPTLLRNAQAQRWSWTDLRDTEATLFWEFEARARDLHERQLTDWDVLFYMREHGVATRVLDWSEIVGVAVYFALRGWVEGKSRPCIWLLNAYALNKKSWETRDLISPRYLGSYRDLMADYNEEFGWAHPVALYPVQRNERLRVQHGYFTIHGESRKPLDEAHSKFVRKVVIDPEEVAGLRTFLERAGFDEYTLFADLDSLARYLHAKYRLS